MKEKTERTKPFWRTASESNPVITRRFGLAIGGGFIVFLFLDLAPFVLPDVAGVKERTAYLVIFGSFGAVLGLLLVASLVLLAIGIPRELRQSNTIWRKRMASGFYKTLPPVKDDYDD